MTRRLSLLVLAVSLPAAAARADLQVTIPGRPAPPASAPAGKPAPQSAKLRAPAPHPQAATHVPRQVGIALRNGPPILPPAAGSSALAGAATEPGGTVSVEARLGKLVAPMTDVYRLPTFGSQWLARLQKGQPLAIVSQWNGWYCILMADGSQAYVPKVHVELEPYLVKSIKAEPAKPALAFAGPDRLGSRGIGSATLFPPPPTDLARAVIAAAFRYEGTRYVYGGNGERGIDCSGLVKNCFGMAGISLPRQAHLQAEVGQAVPLDQLQPGDRLYFSVRHRFDHTGIYLGNGYFIHAAMSRGKVTIDQLSTPLYGRHLAAARRS